VAKSNEQFDFIYWSVEAKVNIMVKGGVIVNFMVKVLVIFMVRVMDIVMGRVMVSVMEGFAVTALIYTGMLRMRSGSWKETLAWSWSWSVSWTESDSGSSSWSGHG
jgi:hypothetical protein